MCVICTGEYNGEPKLLCSCRNLKKFLIDTPGLEKLDFRWCPLLEEIPVISGLLSMSLYECELIKEIPVIPGLKTLSVVKCLFLKKIPVIPGLEKLSCSRCPLLEKIPVIRGLKQLYFYECHIEKIPFTPGLQLLECRKCPKLKEIADMRYLWTVCVDCPLLEKSPAGFRMYFFNCPWVNKKRHRVLCNVQIRIKFIMNKRKKKLPYFPENVEKILEKY